MSSVSAARNVALTPWGTPVENLDSPKTKKLDRVPSMPLGKLLPTSGYVNVECSCVYKTCSKGFARLAILTDVGA